MLNKANYLFSYFNIASQKALNIELCDDVKETQFRCDFSIIET